jgi:hypothetical protein
VRHTKEIPSSYKRRTSSTINFGYTQSKIEGYLKPIPKQLEYLEQAVLKIETGESTRTVAKWLSKVTNRSISNMGLWKYIKRNTSLKFNEIPDTYSKKRRIKAEKKLRKALKRRLLYFNTVDKGFIYIVTSPSFNGWIKVGQTIDVERRCRNYNHTNPRGDWILECFKKVENKHRAETILLNKIKKLSIKHSGREWFKLTNKNKEKAITIFKEYKDKKITMKKIIRLNEDGFSFLGVPKI